MQILVDLPEIVSGGSVPGEAGVLPSFGLAEHGFENLAELLQEACAA